MTLVDLVHPNDFFRNKVHEACQGLNIDLNDDIEFYLVNLLCDFIQPKSFEVDGINLLDMPLALIYKEALEANPARQIKVFKSLGDMSLYVAGYFSPSLNRKTVSSDYYISMGSTAYQRMSLIMRDKHNDEHFTRMYLALSSEFKSLVEVVSKLSSEIPIESHDLLKIYEKWCSNPSDSLRQYLLNEGIPLDSLEKAQ